MPPGRCWTPPIWNDWYRPAWCILTERFSPPRCATRSSAPASVASPPRPWRVTGLWRALTPQLFRRGDLERALQTAAEQGIAVTDESMAMERIGLRPLLVEGGDDNLKVTTPADLAYAAFRLSLQGDSQA